MNFGISNKLVTLIKCYNANTLSTVFRTNIKEVQACNQGQMWTKTSTLSSINLTLEKIIKNMQKNR